MYAKSACKCRFHAKRKICRTDYYLQHYGRRGESAIDETNFGEKKSACIGDETMRCRGDTVIVVAVGVDMNRQWALASFDLLRIVIFLQLYLR